MTAFDRLGAEVKRANPVLNDAVRARQRARLVESVSSPQRPFKGWALAAALCVGLAAAGLIHVGTRSWSREPSAEYPQLQWWVQVPANTVQSVATRGEVELVKNSSAHLQREGKDVSIVLDQGEVRSHVVPHRDTHWSVRAGAYLIEAVGTRFSVAYEPADARVDVAVQEGTVHVSGGQLGSSKVALESGQSLGVRGTQVSIERSPAVVPASPSLGSAEPHPREPPAEVALVPTASAVVVREAAPPARASSGAAHREPSWLELERAGEHRAALELAVAQGFDGLVGSLGCTELGALADAARLARDSVRAERALTVLSRRCRTSASGQRAAFLLGRLEETQNPSGAVAWYEEYLSSGAGEFAEQALGRIVAVEQRQGRTELARSHAKRYLELYPTGSYTKMARSIASP